MGEPDGIANLLKHRQQLRQRIRLHCVLQDLTERDALDQLHRVKQLAAFVHAKLVHRHDAGMLQTRRHPRFLDEAERLRFRQRCVRRNHLHRHRAGQVTIHRGQHLAHPAASDLRANFVVARLLQGFFRRP
jgi:hypothetical protein